MGKIAIIFLFISLNMCFGSSKEPSHRDSSFEYPQHMFWLRNKKNDFQLRILIWRSASNMSVSGFAFILTNFTRLFFSRLVGQVTHGAKNGVSFSEMKGPSISN